MAKISTYDNASPVALDDKVIGTSVDGSPSNVTKNFLISDILGLATAATLDDVLTAGNSSAQSMLLTGSATINDLRVDNMKITNLSAYLDNASALAGGLVPNDVYRTPTGSLQIVY
jgi:hypothetical protein